MNIKLNSSSFVSFKENILSSFSPQQKKYLLITAIATIAFGLLALCCAKLYAHFKATNLSSSDYEEVEIGQQTSYSAGKKEDTKASTDTKASFPKENFYSKDGQQTFSFKTREDTPKYSTEKTEDRRTTLDKDLTHKSLDLKTVEKVNSKKPSSFIEKVPLKTRDWQGNIFEGSFDESFTGHGKRTCHRNYIDYQEGDFVEGRLVKGKKSYENGDFEDGDFDLGGLVKGTAYTFSNNSLYEGIFRNRKLFDGTKTRDGIVFVGKFKYNQLSQGKIIYKNGDIEEGEFQNEKLHGQGKRIYKNGDIEEGQFSFGVFQETEEKPKVDEPIEPPKIPNKEPSTQRKDFAGNIYEGLFDKTFTGNGKKTDCYNDKDYEEGDFEKGLLVKGKKILDNGNYDEGDFRGGILVNGTSYFNGVLSEGEFLGYKLIKGKKTQEGNTFEGDFDFLDQLFGQGKITYQNGDLEEGEFKHGKLNGQGKRTYENGVIEEGEFSFGVFQKTEEKSKVEDLFEPPKIPSEKPLNQKKDQYGNTYQGEFDEYFNGTGKTIISEYTYEGEFKLGQLLKGKITRPNGDYDDGFFPHGFLTIGKKRETQTNGNIHEGDYVGYYHGPGKIIYKNGEVEEGHFKNGTFFKASDKPKNEKNPI